MEQSNVQALAFDSMVHGRGAVALAGTAVALSTATIERGGDYVQTGTNTLFQSITVKAPSSNTGLLYVGGLNVSSLNGFELEAGAAINLNLRNLEDIFVDVSVSTEIFLFFGVL